MCQITLGDLIEALERRDASAPIRVDCPIHIGLGMLDSYRGYYEQLAFTPLLNGHSIVGDVLNDARAADGHIFTGYKGGGYRMGLGTRLWVSDYGMCDRAMVVGVRDAKWGVRLVVEEDDSW